ncbi:hypothetical protein OPQ81_007462 [Rhizoctonia solani]|nr:hypothetical protein OPQ81_007462 [Rhizoctonia solani]
MLPLLFEKVVMLPPLEDFTQIILNETVVPNDLSVPDFRLHVRRLDVRWAMDKQQLEILGRALPILQNLEHLCWNVWKLAWSGVQWHDTLVFIHQELPKLRSLSLIIAKNEIALGNSIKVVSLSKLRELEIDFSGTTLDRVGNQRELPNTLVELVRGASNIESLSLSFEEDNECSDHSLEMLDLFSALSPNHFPKLRKLSTVSSFVPDNEGFQQFIRSHGKLQKIILNTGDYDPNWWDDSHSPPIQFTTQFVEELMPSIRHFGGPGCFVGPLLKSSLSSQLEILELIEPASEKFGTVSKLLKEIGNYIIPELPCLRGLKISIGGDDEDEDEDDSKNWENVLGALCRVVNRMPLLEELIIDTSQEPSSDELDKLFELLGELPHLCRLAVPTRTRTRRDVPARDELQDELRSLYECTKVCFPRLQIGSSSQLVSCLS